MEREVQRKKGRLEKIKTARERRQKLREVKQSSRKRESAVKGSPPATPMNPMANDSISKELLQKQIRPGFVNTCEESGDFL